MSRALGGARAGRAMVIALGVALPVLVLVQVTLVTYLPTPWAAPDLVVVLVLALAVARGPLVGGAAGLWAGAMLDLLPPAAGPLAGWSLVLGLGGVLVGQGSVALRPGPVAAMAILGLGAGLAVLARMGLLWFAGDPVRADTPVIALASAGYALLLAPIALLLVTPRAPAATAPVRTVPPEVVAP